MITLCAVSALEISIGVGAACLVVFTIAYNIVRKKKGKSNCGCSSGCKGCPYSQQGTCPSCKTKDKTNED